MGKITVPKNSKERMLIMTYGDGISFEDIPAFIKGVEQFVITAKEEHKGELVKLYFLPQDLAEMMLAASEKDEANNV